MFVVKFSDKTEFNFTENQIKFIPYFKTLIESNFKTDFQINQASMGFEFIHTYATLDEIDITDPGDKYLFVLKQCDFFCYDKLKELIERKYGFRTDVSEVKDKLGTRIRCELIYIGGFSINASVSYDRGTPIIYPVIQPPVFSSDDEINTIFKRRYIKQVADMYENTIFKTIFTNTNIKLKRFIKNYNGIPKDTYSFYVSVEQLDVGCNNEYTNLILNSVNSEFFIVIETISTPECLGMTKTKHKPAYQIYRQNI